MQILATYQTRGGKIAAEVSRFTPQSKSCGWIGAYGAGSAGSIGEIKEAVLSAMSFHKGVKLVRTSEEWEAA